jgi:voltage-dependent potassium channel beta subunit
MIYRRLGNSGLKVSIFSFGNWLTGENPHHEQTQIQLVKRAFDAGINYFDTAEEYGNGTAEILMGKALKALECPRADLVIATKLFWGKSDKFPNINDKGLSRKHLVEGMKASLKRLQLEYVDIVFCHRPDDDVELEETCKAMSWLIDQGHALYWATSEWPACLVTASIEICKRLNLNLPIADQMEYNMLTRNRMEKDYTPVFQRYGYGTTVWSPLASGLLTGKYNNGDIPEGSRFSSEDNQGIYYNYTAKFGSDLFEKLKKLADMAKELGCSQAQLALLWAISNKDVTTIILGASNVNQLEQNLEVLKLIHKWNAKWENEVGNILNNAPEPDMDFRLWFPKPSRREDHISKL